MSEAKRGVEVHLNRNISSLGPSATLAINEQSNELIAEGRRVYKLGLGQSPFPVPPSVIAALREHAHEKDYLPVQGLVELREAVASFHQRRGDGEFSARDVIIGPGSKELMFILQLCFSGRLLIPRPSWVSYEPQAQICGLEVQWLGTQRQNGWCLTGEALTAHCKAFSGPQLLILNTPNNPTGMCYDASALQSLASVARAHGVLILSDEIYGELHHQGQHISMAKYYPEGTIVSSGLSKWCGAGGWRLGSFCFPPQLSWLRDAMCAVASETFTSVSAPIQYASITAFQGSDELSEYLQRSRQIVAALGRWVAQRLRDSGTLLADPQGAFYLFPDFSNLAESLRARGIDNSPTLCERALSEAGVAFLPGSKFGQDPSELVARIAFVNFDGDAALKLAVRWPQDMPLDQSFLEQACPDTLEAIHTLSQWLEG